MPAYRGTGEVWRAVPSEPQFVVSSEGRFMVRPYWADMPNGGKRSYGGEPRFGVWSKIDGRFITVWKGKSFKIHQLVCEAFNGSPPFEKAVVMHLDENAANNRADNLAWGTQRENLNADGFKDYLTDRNLERSLMVRHDLAE